MICKYCKLTIEPYRPGGGRYSLVGSNRPLIPKGPLRGQEYLIWCPSLTDGLKSSDFTDHEPMNESDNVREILNRYEE